MGRPQKPAKSDVLGTLDLLILSRLAKGAMHGFGIADYLNQVSDVLRVEEGSLYPALHRLESQGFESIAGPHPVVPLLVRDTDRTRAFVKGLFERGVLAVGLTYPVVPRGDETIRFQVNAAHTEADIRDVLAALAAVRDAA